MSTIEVEYCDEWWTVTEDDTFTIGRTADLSVDDNPYLHRTFLEIRHQSGVWLVANVGSIESLSAVHGALARVAKDVNVWMINIARGTYQLERVRFEALNPTFLLGVIKPGKN